MTDGHKCYNDNMKLALYIADVEQARFQDWVSRLTQTAQGKGMNVRAAQLDVSCQASQIPVVSDDLCAAATQCVEFEGPNSELLREFAYKCYQSQLSQGWQISLYEPDLNGVSLSFDERSIALRVAHLYYQDGTSDKVYHLYLVRPLTLEFYSVVSHFGRRGRALQSAEKVFDYRLDAAEREWNSLHHEKIQKGYQTGRPPSANQLELELPF